MAVSGIMASDVCDGGGCEGTAGMARGRSKMVCALQSRTPGGGIGDDDDRHRVAGSPAKPHNSLGCSWAQASAILAPYLSS